MARTPGSPAIPQFPSKVWDGTSPGRDQQGYKAPDADDYNQLVAEIKALQSYSLEKASSFGKIIETSSINAQFYGGTLQYDGKLITVGQIYTDWFYPSISRYNIDGTLDAQIVMSNIIGGQLNDCVVLPSGKILATGYYTGDLDSINYGFIARFNPDLSLDPVFGIAGIWSYTLNDGLYLQCIVIQSDGKIIVGGWTSVSGFNRWAIMRMNPDGSLDATFTVNFGTDDETITTITLQKDGKILAAGWAHTGNSRYDTAIARLNTDGTLDTSFNSTGKIVKQVGVAGSQANSIIVQPDAMILVGGINLPTAFVLRYDPTGTLDPSFGTSGIYTFSFLATSTKTVLWSIRLRPDGHIVLACSHFIGTKSSFGCCQLNSNGISDTIFGQNVIVFRTNYIDEPKFMVMRSNDQIIVGGNSSDGSNTYQPCLVQIDEDGSVDTSVHLFNNRSGNVLPDPIDQPFMIQRLTTAQRNAISSPPEGLMVYDTSIHLLCIYDGSGWKKVTVAAAP